jgi:hypothetical protein
MSENGSDFLAWRGQFEQLIADCSHRGEPDRLARLAAQGVMLAARQLAIDTMAVGAAIASLASENGLTLSPETGGELSKALEELATVANYLGDATELLADKPPEGQH